MPAGSPCAPSVLLSLQEEMLKKKYGGVLPKKKNLLTKVTQDAGIVLQCL